MARMFVEGRVGSADTLRDAAQKLMRELDVEAAEAQHRVVGDVSIFEVQHDLLPGVMLRLEADVEPV